MADLSQQCRSCKHCHGQTYNGNLFVCGLYPSGYGAGSCPDWEQREPGQSRFDYLLADPPPTPANLEPAPSHLQPVINAFQGVKNAAIKLAETLQGMINIVQVGLLPSDPYEACLFELNRAGLPRNVAELRLQDFLSHHPDITHEAMLGHLRTGSCYLNNGLIACDHRYHVQRQVPVERDRRLTPEELSYLQMTFTRIEIDVTGFQDEDE